MELVQEGIYFATALFHRSGAIAAVIGVAYLLWIAWLLLVALGLFRLSRQDLRGLGDLGPRFGAN